MVRQRRPSRRRAGSRGDHRESPRGGVGPPGGGARARVPPVVLLPIPARGAAARLRPVGRAQHARLVAAKVPGAGSDQLGHPAGRVPDGRDAALHGEQARCRADRRRGERSDRDRRDGAIGIARGGGSRRPPAHPRSAAARRRSAHRAPDGPVAGILLRRADARRRPHRLGVARGAGSQPHSRRGAALPGRLHRPRRPAAGARGIALARRAGAAP